MQFSFVPGCETTNDIFILRQLQQKYKLKEEFVLCICRFVESFWEIAQECCMVSYKITRCCGVNALRLGSQWTGMLTIMLETMALSVMIS